MAPPPPAGIIWRRCRRKTDGAPPSQPRLSAAAAAEIFTAHRGAVMIIVVKLVNFNALQAVTINEFNNFNVLYPTVPLQSLTDIHS